MEVVGKRRVLSECLKMYESELKRYSKHLNGLEPMSGYEEVFRETEKRCEIIRDMIRDLSASVEHDALEAFVKQNREALRDPNVKRKVREWQAEVMAGNIPTLWELKPGGEDE